MEGVKARRDRLMEATNLMKHFAAFNQTGKLLPPLHKLEVVVFPPAYSFVLTRLSLPEHHRAEKATFLQMDRLMSLVI